MLSKDLIKIPGYKLNVTIDFLNSFTPITQAVGALFEVIDPLNYRKYSDNFNSMADNTPAKIMRTTSRNCFLGMAILVDLYCKLHQDSRDTTDGWVADVAFGEFQGGHLQVPQIGFSFQLNPGDVIFMRSSLLLHSVSEVTSGSRIGVVFFTHESMQD